MTVNTDNTNNETIDGAEGTDTVVEHDNPLGLSDDDFLKQAPPAANAVLKAEESGQKTDAAAEDDNDEDTDPKNKGAETDEADGGTPAAKAGEGDDKKVDPKEKTTNADDKSGEKVADKTDDKSKTVDKDGKEVKKAEDDKSGDKPNAEKGEALDVTAKAAAYDRLMAPFKANGREIQARSIEDAISLMQMGANYNKRMAGLKPSLKVVKLLENHGLLDEEKLGFLIDLHAKKPEAITKLVKDAGLNPMDLDLDKAGEYRSSKHTVDDREMALDAVLDDIKESGTYTKTLGIAQGWDADSKKVIGETPVLLKVINDHVERGIYDLICTEVEREKTFGRLQGLSDIAAYRQVGDAIQARGGFDHLAQPDGAAKVKDSEAGKVVEPKPKKADDESRNEKRRALGSARTTATQGKVAQEFNPLGLSDDEFLKQATPKFR